MGNDHFHNSIFDIETHTGRFIDRLLIVLILASVGAVLLESMPSMEHLVPQLRVAEWIFTAIFTIEYGARLFVSRHTRRYATSFFGVVDFLSVIPTYLSYFFAGAHAFLIIRLLRLLRFFRIFKMARYITGADTLIKAFRASRPKIVVFLSAVAVAVVIVGAVMHVVEHDTPGFESIPHAMYWSAVTLSTVGYGDVIPMTPFGKFLAAIIMVMGYGIIAVPTGVLSVEIARASKGEEGAQEADEHQCAYCGASDISMDDRYCKYCGNFLRTS